MDPNELMLILWIPVFIVTFILFLYVLIKIKSFNAFQKSNSLLVGIVFILGCVAIVQSENAAWASIPDAVKKGIAPQNVQETQISTSEAVIQWDTLKPITQSLLYMVDRGDEQIAYPVTRTVAVTRHTVLLQNLQWDSHYRYKIILGGQEILPQDPDILEFTLH